jgi:anaerobic selenocysteine-containing dehydrogenase
MMTIPLMIRQTTKGQAICPYCGVGCGLWMESAHGELIRVKGVVDAPANLGGICAKGATLPEVIQTPDRLMQPHARPRQPPRETADHEFPLVLTMGRLYARWHTLTRTGKSPKLVRREPSAFVEIHPDDAVELGLTAGQLAELSSRRGSIRLPVKINPGLSRGVVFVPFHWGDQQGEDGAASYLTISAIDRVAKQPEFKYCAVRLAPAPDSPDFARTPPPDKPHKAAFVDESPRGALGTNTLAEPPPATAPR